MGLLSDILAKLSSDPSTATKQDTGNASLDSIDDKLVAVANSSTPYIVLCGKQPDGTITPIQVDATGQIIIEGT